MFGCRFFPVFSADSEKVADLQISVVLDSLMGEPDILFYALIRFFVSMSLLYVAIIMHVQNRRKCEIFSRLLFILKTCLICYPH